MKYLYIVFLFFAMVGCKSQETQIPPYQLSLEPLHIDGFGGLQSYAFAQHKGKWLIVGGRLDGLHKRQPWASFDLAGHNTSLWVIDPIHNTSYSYDLSALPLSIKEPLSSTNMESIQIGNFLYCMGGYGYSSEVGDHITFPTLTVLDVPKVMEGILKEQDISGYIRQVSHPQYQVTGGKLLKIDTSVFLMGGQKFMGRYNPRGPDFGPGFEQQYHEKVVELIWKNNTDSIQLQATKIIEDTALLHRRDFNAAPGITPEGTSFITLFSGVFQHDEDIPFLNTVHLTPEGITENPEFEQLFNHYHCPVIPIYNTLTQNMEWIFLGGIAQYYYEGEQLIRDDNVPFVKTISKVTRTPTGEMYEEILPIEMPDYLGAGAEFIINPKLTTIGEGILVYPQEFKKEPIGYFIGGIQSDEKNILFTEDGESTASPIVYAIYLQ